MDVRDGIMLVDKPAGITSHDVVNALRKLLKIRRVGHTGILDPGATGLMVMLLGRGTLFSGFLIDMPKRYTCRLAFGSATDTYDADGRIISETDPGSLPRVEFEEVLKKYTGRIEQAIPPYSAAKRNGVPLYKLARRGVAIKPRHKVIEVEEMKIVDYDWPEVALDIKCSSGTYVRSLAHQMGEDIGCGGYLKSLRRLEIGPFHISMAVSLDEIKEAYDVSEMIRPLRNALPQQPIIHIKPQYYGAVLDGQPLFKKYIGEGSYKGDGGILSILLGPDDKVLALARLNMHWRVIDKLGPSEIMGTYVRVIDEGRLRVR